MFWVHASNLARFHETYETIAQNLSLPGLENPNIDILRLVRNWLSDERHGSWLMILDNVDDMETFFTTSAKTPSALISYKRTMCTCRFNNIHPKEFEREGYSHDKGWSRW